MKAKINSLETLDGGAFNHKFGSILRAFRKKISISMTDLFIISILTPKNLKHKVKCFSCKNRINQTDATCSNFVFIGRS